MKLCVLLELTRRGEEKEVGSTQTVAVKKSLSTTEKKELAVPLQANEKGL